MGLFSSKKTDFPWVNITTIEELQEVLKSEGKILLFKHSTRCSISSMALRTFEKEYNVENSIACYFLDLINHRDISNEIAEITGIRHESPQVIVLENKLVLYNASHENIDALKINTL